MVLCVGVASRRPPAGVSAALLAFFRCANNSCVRFVRASGGGRVGAAGARVGCTVLQVRCGVGRSRRAVVPLAPSLVCACGCVSGMKMALACDLRRRVTEAVCALVVSCCVAAGRVVLQVVDAVWAVPLRCCLTCASWLRFNVAAAPLPWFFFHLRCASWGCRLACTSWLRYTVAAVPPHCCFTCARCGCASAMFARAAGGVSVCAPAVSCYRCYVPSCKSLTAVPLRCRLACAL